MKKHGSNGRVNSNHRIQGFDSTSETNAGVVIQYHDTHPSPIQSETMAGVVLVCSEIGRGQSVLDVLEGPVHACIARVMHVHFILVHVDELGAECHRPGVEINNCYLRM